MTFKVRDLMVDVLATGGKGGGKGGNQTKCGSPTCKIDPQCVAPTNTGTGGYHPENAARDLELLRRELHSALDRPAAAP